MVLRYFFDVPDASFFRRLLHAARAKKLTLAPGDRTSAEAYRLSSAIGGSARIVDRSVPLDGIDVDDAISGVRAYLEDLSTDYPSVALDAEPGEPLLVIDCEDHEIYFETDALDALLEKEDAFGTYSRTTDVEIFNAFEESMRFSDALAAAMTPEEVGAVIEEALSISSRKPTGAQSAARICNAAQVIDLDGIVIGQLVASRLDGRRSLIETNPRWRSLARRALEDAVNDDLSTLGERIERRVLEVLHGCLALPERVPE